MRSASQGSFCLPQACRDAPLGQRQGGVFRLPLPTSGLHPPATGQGLHALDNPKEEVEAQKASAAPVGAIALTLFFASPFIAPQSLRDSSPKGGADTPAALSQKAALQMPFSVTTPPVKMRLERSAERDKREI